MCPGRFSLVVPSVTVEFHRVPGGPAPTYSVAPVARLRQITSDKEPEVALAAICQVIRGGGADPFSASAVEISAAENVVPKSVPVGSPSWSADAAGGGVGEGHQGVLAERVAAVGCRDAGAASAVANWTCPALRS